MMRGVDQRRVVANKRRREEETREPQVRIKTVRDLVARVASAREPSIKISRGLQRWPIPIEHLIEHLTEHPTQNIPQDISQNIS